MVEPPAELGAGGHVLDPEVHGGPLLAQPARPEPFHQDPQAVIRSGLLVYPLQANLRHPGSSFVKDESARCLGARITPAAAVPLLRVIVSAHIPRFREAIQQ